MRGISAILLLTAMLSPSGLMARGDKSVSAPADFQGLITRLDAITPFAADVDYSVSMPLSTDDVVYHVELASTASATDSILGVDYLIDWTLPRTETTAKGFLAYFDGHHYRYRDHRLQEYHFTWDSVPFLAKPPVQTSGQFVELLPSSIARDLTAMANDTSFIVKFTPDTIFTGRHVSVVTATQNVRGYVGRNSRYIFSLPDYMPLRISHEYNPGAVSEQSVDVSYTYPTTPSLTAVSSEEQLMALYPDVFANFRESNFRIENMRSLPLPSFSLPDLSGQRFTYQKGTPMQAPTVIAVIDPLVDSARATVHDLRAAIDRMPCHVDLILAFVSSNSDIIEETAGTPDVGETILMSAKSFARDCGTSVFPTILTVSRTGIIENIILGFNNDLISDVIQSVAVL